MKYPNLSMMRNLILTSIVFIVHSTSVLSQNDFPPTGTVKLDANLRLEEYSNSTSDKSQIRFYKAEGTSSSPTAVSDNHILGEIAWYGLSGTSFKQAASMRAIIDGSPTGSNPPTELTFRTSDGNNWPYTRMTIKPDGKVGIGTRSPDELLTVAGKIHTEAINVDLNVPGPDYVFEEDYELRTLEETEEYIQTHKHLPEIPSAKEMEEQGIDLVAMNMLLLKKVEELTLIVIDQNKRIESLEN